MSWIFQNFWMPKTKNSKVNKNIIKDVNKNLFSHALHWNLYSYILLVNIPATWNVVPSLETDQKITVDHTSSPKTEVTGIDKGLQISDTKVSTKTIEQTSPADAAREKRFDFVVDNGKNINIVMIIADPGQDQEEFWKNFKASHLFSVEGMLQVWFSNIFD